MNYIDKFKDMLKNTILGLLIGLVSAIALAILIGYLTKELSFIEIFAIGLVLVIMISPIASIVLCAKNKTRNYIGTTSKSAFELMFSLTGDAVSLVGAHILIKLIMLIPAVMYMIISYMVFFIYYGIMALLEKKNVLYKKHNSYDVIDKFMSAACWISVIVIIIVFIKYIVASK